jgi:hypothetical protein
LIGLIELNKLIRRFTFYTYINCPEVVFD